jgi:DNA polymerase III subunit delta
VHVWYLFHGPNAIERDERITEMIAKIGEPEVASMNTSVFTRGATVDEIMGECETMPFLAEKRMIIARNVLGGITGGAKGRKAKTDTDTEKKSPLDQLLAYLPGMNDAARLIFAEDDLLDEKHPLLKLAEDKASHGTVKAYGLPTDPVKWITERAKSKGAEIHPQAAQLLSTKINRGDKNDRDHVQMDARTYLPKLDTELDKLAAYCLNRRIESKDVELLVADEQVADIFKFIDAISVRNAGEAYKVVRGVVGRGESPLVVLSHIARQVRVLIQVKDHPQLSSDALAAAIGVHPFVAKKASQQAGRFQHHELTGAMQALLEADIAIKTGRMDENTALDVLIAALCA